MQAMKPEVDITKASTDGPSGTLDVSRGRSHDSWGWDGTSLKTNMTSHVVDWWWKTHPGNLTHSPVEVLVVEKSTIIFSLGGF